MSLVNLLFYTFNAVKEKVCRKPFCNQCHMVSEYFDFEMMPKRTPS